MNEEEKKAIEYWEYIRDTQIYWAKIFSNIIKSNRKTRKNMF